MRRFIFIGAVTIISFLLSGGAYAMTAALNGDAGTSLNSNTDSSAYGNANEAYFFRIKNANSPNPGFTNGTIDINDDAVLMQAFIDNSSATETARNTTLTITLPTGFASSQTAIATLKSDNAGTLTDNVSMVDSQSFGLAFDQSAAVYVAKRSGSGANNYVNTATGNYQINGNVMTVNLGDWAGGDNQQGVVTVRVKVLRPAAVQPATFVCSGLDRSSIDNNRSTFTARSNGQAAGVNISSYNFTVRDGSGRVVDNSTINTDAQSAVYNFNQSNPGTYTITATANSDKGSTTVNNACTQSLTVSAPPATLAASTSTTSNAAPAAPAKTTLPNTGAGDVLGLFTGASVLGTAGHYVSKSRRFRR